MKEMTIIMDAREEGREAERLNVITDMLRRGKTVEEIVDFCNYPLELVKEVEESLASNV